ncbi:MAG: Wzz/FepE/Etk N-terminal domain-containing protein [Acetobacteraceae bacterium]|nr:Wzz/FepE/Etk N-terminal domain-containing protein [Acetobacteraceae bacterium]
MTAKIAIFDWAPDLLAFLRRAWLTVAACTVIMGVLGVAYLLFATPRFSASSTVFIDMQAAAPFKADNTPIDSQFANGLAESQVEVLESEGLARVVVDQLHLADNAAFMANGNSLVNTVLGVLLSPLSTPLPKRADSHETAAAELLTKMIRVKRVGLSYILELSVVSRDPVMSAQLANAVVDAFVDYGLDAKGANTRRASKWLEQRIGELQQQATAADQAVQTFKAQAGIVDTDKGLMNERHLGELNSQLVLARARSADAKARVDRIRQIMQSGTWTGDTTDALNNLVITHLREQYVDAARQAAEWTAQVGPNHAAVKQMNDKLKDIQVQIQSELKRIAESAESDNQMALSNQKDIEAQLAALVTAGDQTNDKLVQLRALQSTADTYKSLRDNFLVRYTQAVQDQSFPISDVQVVTRAAVPLRKSWPKGLIVLAAAAFVGLGMGFAIALMREALDGAIRTAAQVRSSLGLPCLGMLPALKQRAWRDRQPAPVIAGERQIAAPPLMRQTSLAPFSPYAEAIRGLRLRLTRTRQGRRDVNIIGCVSALPGEGKSTVSANFAFFLAEAGFRTVLVDGDLRKRTLSTTLAPACRAGFVDVMADLLPLEDALWHDAASKLAFLPALADATPTALPNLAGTQAQALFAKLRTRFDFVVVDLPAILPVADAAAASNLVDGVVMVVEWARTPEDVVRECIEHNAIDPTRLLGVVLNKVHLKSLRHYHMAASSYGTDALIPA